MGIGTDKVAGDVVAAIRENRFWIFTHDLTRPTLLARARDVEALRNPTDPYDGIPGFEALQQGGD